MEKGKPYCQCLLFSANALARVVTRIADEEFSPVNLPYSYAFLLMQVNKSPGRPIGELSEALMLSPSTITRLVEKLEEKNLITRVTEGRQTLVYPTQQSLRLDDHLKLCWKKVYERFLDVLGTDETHNLTSRIFEAALRLEHPPES